MDNKNKITGFDIVKSASGDLKDITTDLAEASLDQYLDDGLLNDIPFLGTGVKVVGLAKKISDAFYTKKIVKFLFKLKDIPEDKRQSFFVDLASKKEKQRLDESLTTFLNRFEDDRKASLLGNIFKAYILGKINQETFFRLTWCIDKAFIGDLLEMKKGGKVTKYAMENLAEVGFYKVSVSQSKGLRGDAFTKHGGTLGMVGPEETRIRTDVGMTSLGKLFMEYNGL